MSSIFGSIKKTARTGRLKTELLLLDREVRLRQESFGIQLFDYLEPLAQNPNFFSADDRLTQVLRPPLLEAQREIAVVYNKKVQLKERMKQAEAKRAAAFPKKAENWQEKLSNVAKSTSLAGGEAKLKAEEMVLDNTLKAHKQIFGTKLYPVLEKLEDTESWLPTDREVRTIYDNCRRDIEGIRKRAKVKEEELETLGISKKEIQQERDAVTLSENQQQQQELGAAAGAGGFYDAPPPSSNMVPVHVAPPPPRPSDPFATAPTAALPVARPVHNPGYPSAETPVLAYATTAPTPPPPPPGSSTNMFSQPPPQFMQQQQPPQAAHMGFGTAGVGPMGGTPMGGGMGNSGSLFQGHNPSSSAILTGSDHSRGEDGSGGFMMGGTTGMGTSSSLFSSSAPMQQQQQLPHQNTTAAAVVANPWGGNDPFSAFAADRAAPPPPPPPPMDGQPPQQHKDSNLFLF